MATTKLLSHVCAAAVGLAVAVAFSCSSNGGGVPDKVDSGFTLANDAFTFSNYAAEYPASIMTPDLAARMFSPAVPCVNGATPCQPSGLASTWISTVNDALAEGHSEGMSVLALLFFMGKLDPSAFGANSAPALALDGNAGLQQEIAYWAATQNVPSAIRTQGFQAYQVMPFLAGALQPGSTERYRLAMAAQTATGGLQSGHSVVPIGYFLGPQPNLYYLRVYDNNFPQSERLVAIDVQANTWFYNASTDPTAPPIVYSGDGTNGNLLYFTAVTPRIGVLQAPFDPRSNSFMATSAGPVNMAVTDSSGNVTGIMGGQATQSGGASVAPSFASCACSPTNGITNVFVPAGSAQTVSLAGTGSTTNGGKVTIIQSGSGDGGAGGAAAVSVSGVTGAATGTATVTLSGSGNSTTFSSSTGTPVTVSSTQTVPGGGTITTTVTTTGNATGVTITNANGQVAVSSSGTAAGTTITVTVTETVNGQTTSTTMTQTSSGASGSTPVGTVSTTTLQPTPTEHCSDTVQDDGELGVDCAGTCPLCADGKACTSSAVCTSNLCDSITGVCIDPGCHNGYQDPDETDIDCGGSSCSPCVAAACNQGEGASLQKQCKVASDCDSNVCVAEPAQIADYYGAGQADAGAYTPASVGCLPAGTLVCMKKQPVNVSVVGMPPGNSVTLSATFDGTTTTKTVQGSLGPNSQSLGDAYSYDVTVTSATSPYVCTAQGNVEANPSAEPGTIQINCSVFYGSNTLSLNVSNSNAYFYASSENVKFGSIGTAVLDGVSKPIAMPTGSNPVVSLGSYSKSYSVTLVSPLYWTYDGTHYFADTIVGANPETGAYSKTSAAVTLEPSFTHQSGLGQPPDAGTGVTDAGHDSGGGVDSGGSDSGGGVDSGGSDSGGGVDSGSEDSGGTVDTGAPDASEDSGSFIACTADTDCATSDCECGASSGNCTGNSGSCGAAMTLIDTPTADGTTASGTFTVPAGCTAVYVEAWGAAGGPGGMTGGFGAPLSPGGAGGYASGVVSVVPGDTLSVWVGQGGALPTTGPTSGTPGTGSLAGTATNGGAGDGDPTVNAGGGGGGLTSITQSGSSSVVLGIPAGGGASAQSGGDAVGNASNTPNGSSNAGASATSGSTGGGGGAGQPGGAASASAFSPGSGGAYGSLPSGLSSSNSTDSVNPANNGANDYATCGSDTGDGPAGAGSLTSDYGGDGCVVLRCVAQ